MKLYVFLSSSRALGVLALKNHLALACEVRAIDLGRGEVATAAWFSQKREQPGATSLPSAG